MPTPTMLYLIRHGATRLNLERPYRLQGRGIDELLAPLGMTQAECAGAALAGWPIRAVYSSPLGRARQTAEVIARFHNLPVRTEQQLIEADVGCWEGRAWQEIRANEPDAYARFIAEPGTYGYAGGETFDQVLARVAPSFASLLRRHRGESIVVVAHQVVNRVYLGSLLKVPSAQARRIRLANGGISVVTLDGDEPQLVTLNAALHLPPE